MDAICPGYCQGIGPFKDKKEGFIIYASRESQTLLSQHHVPGSMSAKGNCYDNAAMESFWVTLKTDMTIVKPFKPKEDARRAVFDYIETFYEPVSAAQRSWLFTA